MDHSITSSIAEIWGRLTYRLPSSTSVLESVDVKGERYVIGRAKDCHLQIGLKMISGHHCYLGKEDNGKMFLFDTSTNGTLANGNRIVNGQCQEIFDGDIIHLIRKKTAPDQDFHLLFKTVSNKTDDDESGPSGAELEPKTKRIKVEPSTSGNDVVVKAENCNDLEDQLPTGRASNLITGDADVQILNVYTENEKNTVAVKKEESKKEKEDDKVVNSTSSDSIEDILKCSLCLEVFHDPVCLQPCMHCYCAGCYSDWMACSNDCPQCRAPVQLIAKNHMISSLTDTFLKNNPDKRRSLSEINILNSKNSIVKQFLQPQVNHPDNCQCENCPNGTNSSNNSNSSDGSQVVYQTFPQRICQQCPGNAKSANTASVSQPGSSTSAQTADFVCGPSQSHISCTCCFKLMPDRRYEVGTKPQTCELCLRIFCHMYWSCTKIDCSGCLNTFSNLRYSNNNLTKMINDNVVETRILSDYVQAKGQTLQNIIENCLTSLDSGKYQLAINLKSTSVLCYKCGLSNMQTLIYKYRTDIPEGDLPDSVTSRPKCYWGLNCRTQKHNMNHAQKFNHICNQTRF